MAAHGRAAAHGDERDAEAASCHGGRAGEGNGGVRWRPWSRRWRCSGVGRATATEVEGGGGRGRTVRRRDVAGHGARRDGEEFPWRQGSAAWGGNEARKGGSTGGGSEPRLVKAATEQLNKLPFYHSFWNHTTRPSLDLAKELISMFTAREMGKVFFTNSGSEANDSQVKIVWYYNNALGRPKKKNIISRTQSYHGTTFISASLSGLPTLHQDFDLPGRFVLHTDCPHYWRFHLPGETEEEFATRLADNLENLILKQGPETIAAFIAEPVIGAGGVILPPKTYFEKIQAVVKKYDILFIVDEVITGFGRLGTMFGSDLYNIKPDLVSLAKALSSAYAPIGAILVSPEISDVIHSHSNKLGTFAHGFTYSGHPVSCAVALEALKIYRERDIPGHVTHVAQRFQEGIKAFAAGSPIVGETRGVGLLIATEFTDNKSPYELFPFEWGVGEIFGQECKKRGMMVKVLGNLIAMSPPLIITREEIDKLVSIYGEALKATEERVAELKSKKN
ncbi:hypothetical protein OsJ_05081 [Oryza sativa Japonica Group]|nr:hypothetical protein OsJ_05081 [Oryza sativa Japonica Group]